MHDVYVSMAISHSVRHVTTRPSSHPRSRAVSTFIELAMSSKRQKNASLLFYEKVKQGKLACGVGIVLHNVE